MAQALGDAAAALPGWKKLPGRDRGSLLSRLADAVESRRDELARTITLENGKPLAQSRGEVAMTVDHLRWFAGEAGRAYGRIVPNQVVGKRHLVLRTPVGVVGRDRPWNFPLALAVRKIASGPGGRLPGDSQAGQCHAAVGRDFRRGSSTRPACRRASSSWWPAAPRRLPPSCWRIPSAGRSPSPARRRSAGG